jgi:hypothetical protein
MRLDPEFAPRGYLRMTFGEERPLKCKKRTEAVKSVSRPAEWVGFNCLRPLFSLRPLLSHFFPWRGRRVKADVRTVCQLSRVSLCQGCRTM